MYANARRLYADNGISTASPARLLTMLYDRLVLDLERGETAQRSGNREQAHKEITHAQDILAELQASLRVDVWDGAPTLLSLYVWFTKELIAANVTGDADRTATVRRLVVPLRDAWHEAARQVAAAAPAPALATA